MSIAARSTRPTAWARAAAAHGPAPSSPDNQILRRLPRMFGGKADDRQHVVHALSEEGWL